MWFLYCILTVIAAQSLLPGIACLADFGSELMRAMCRPKDLWEPVVCREEPWGWGSGSRPAQNPEELYFLSFINHKCNFLLCSVSHFCVFVFLWSRQIAAWLWSAAVSKRESTCCKNFHIFSEIHPLNSIFMSSTFLAFGNLTSKKNMLNAVSPWKSYFEYIHNDLVIFTWY